jgi:alkylhydroperoxidase family enzyme
VDAVCRDFESAPIAEREKALFRYLARVNDAPASVTQAEVDAVLAHGWEERAVYDAATVCSIFNFFNRWVDAMGVPDVPKGFYEARLAQQGDLGYRM